MNPEKSICTEAKSILSKNNWPAGVGVILTLGVAMMSVIYFSDMLFIAADYILKLFKVNIFDNISFLPLLVIITFTLAGFTLLLPLLMGAIRFMYLMSKTGNADYSETFYYLKKKRYLKSLGTYLGLIARSLWQAIISFLPAVIFFLFATSVTLMEETPKLRILLYFLSYVLMVGGVLLFNAITTKLFLAIYYYIENDNLSTSEICALSMQHMEKFSGTTVKLNLNLLPLTLACVLIIPAIFVLPYVMTTKATSAKWLIALSAKTEGPIPCEETENKDE